jgi:hypothetical protein
MVEKELTAFIVKRDKQRQSRGRTAEHGGKEGIGR